MIRFKSQSSNGAVLRFLAVCTIICLALILTACNRDGRPDERNSGRVPPEAGKAAAPFRDCPPEGLPGSDAEMNLLKNRDTEPADYEPRTIAEILDSKPQQLTGVLTLPRSDWPGTALAAARQLESKGVIIEGHMLLARKSGPESCNCRRDDLRDWHVWIGAEPVESYANAKRLRNRSVITEPTPRWQSRKGWRLRQFEALARQSARVRVYGWLLWDQEHPEETPEQKGDKATRGTLWEIHPVTKIEILKRGVWVELLDQFIP